jgi:hypothetical protein
VQARGLFVLVHQLPDSSDIEVTAINFGESPIKEAVAIHAAPGGSKAADALDPQATTIDLAADGTLPLQLEGYEGKALRIKVGGDKGAG